MGWDNVLQYLITFIVGGFVCLLGQLLINYTHISSARILVIFLLLGAALEAFGIFEPIKEFAGSGITVPITGFGSSIAKGAIEGARDKGFFGAISGGLTATSGVLTVSIVIGFIIAILFKSKTKE